MIPADIITKVLKHIDRDELINLTSQLVRINSVWDPKAGTSEKPAADLIVRWAQTQGFAVQRDEVAPERPNVIITVAFGPGNRALMFEGHTDVVTPGDISTWTYDPFGAEITGNRMYGRGTNDTKGNLAAMLIAMAALKRSGVKIKGKLIGGVLCDEEDQMLGVLNFIERGHADTISGAIICEPQDGLICTSQKGALRAQYVIEGRMSHGAMPLAGLNTAPAVARIIAGLHQLEKEAVIRCGKDTDLGWPSFTPTVIQAPAAGTPQLNVMPQTAKIFVDIRTIPSQSHKQIKNALAALAEKAEQQTLSHYAEYDRRLGLERLHNLSITLAILTDRPCTFTPQHDPIVLASDWATRKITGQEPSYGGVPGATDGTFLWSLKNIPIVTMGAGDRQVPHQVDEWVDLDQLFETAQIYALAALHYLTPKTHA